jgi:dephospho-CoA kinase
VSVLRVGLTGGLASGKSTVGRLLQAAGMTVVDADRLVSDLYRPGAPGAPAVARALGPQYVTADGAVDKASVARLVFADPAALAALEESIHPLVGRQFEELAARASGIVVLEATKLVEAGLDATLDFVVTVEAEVDAQLRRAGARGLSTAEARARLAAQDDGRRRRARADFVIENSGDLRQLGRRTKELVAVLRARAAGRGAS